MKIIISMLILILPFVAIANEAIVNDCKSVEKINSKRSLFICSKGDLFEKPKRNNWDGDRLIIFKKTSNKITIISDLTEAVPTSEYTALIELIKNKLIITFYGDSLPKWETVAIFKEVINLDTNTSKIIPLINIKKTTKNNYELKFKQINASSKVVAETAKKNNMVPIQIIYTNLFALRDYSFTNPSRVNEMFSILEKHNWNDGEIAEALYYFRAQVKYLTDKSINAI